MPCLTPPHLFILGKARSFRGLPIHRPAKLPTTTAAHIRGRLIYYKIALRQMQGILAFSAKFYNIFLEKAMRWRAWPFVERVEIT
jgi:hypothetical protein